MNDRGVGCISWPARGQAGLPFWDGYISSPSLLSLL